MAPNTKTGRVNQSGGQKRLDRRAIAQLVAANTTGFTENQVYNLIGTLTDTISEQLAAGNVVNITGFGTFKPTIRQARMGVNPHTREKMQIPERRAISFSLGETAMAAISGGAGGGLGGYRSGGGGGGGGGRSRAAGGTSANTATSSASITSNAGGSGGGVGGDGAQRRRGGRPKKTG